MTFIDINREFIKDIPALCTEIIALTEQLNDQTICKNGKLLLKFADEFEKYNLLIDGGELEDVNFKESIESCFNSMNRQLDKHKKVKLVWQQEGISIIDGFEQFIVERCNPSWKLLSTILIDNAVKYAIDETDITINLHQTECRKTIEITNIGPLLNNDELEAVFSLNENYRGENARNTNIEGQGLGLKLAKLIIMSHQDRDATISAECTPKEMKKDGIPYGEITISFSIRNTNLAERNYNSMKGTFINTLDEFLSHEFNRINTLLSKHAVEMLDDSFSRKSEYSPISQCLRLLAFRIYHAIMFHLKWCELLWNTPNDTVRSTGEEMHRAAKRFDKQLFDAVVRTLKCSDNTEIGIEKQGRGYFSFSPMYLSLHLFSFILSQHLINSNFKGVITMNADCQGLQLLAPEGESFNQIAEDDKRILELILKENGLEMNCEDNYSILTIERA